MTSLVKGIPGEISCPDPGGDLIDFDVPPTVTVVRDSTGVEILTGATSSAKPDGSFIVTVPAVDTPDLLSATWDGLIGSQPATITTSHEVYGSHIVGVPAVRDDLTRAAQEPLADDSEIIEKRELAETRIEGACGVAFRPRYIRATVEGHGRNNLLLPTPRLLDVISIDGEATQLPASITGEIEGSSPWVGSHDIAWVHGFDTPPPSVVAAVRQLTVHYLLVDPDDLDGRATFKSNEIASWSLVTPGVKGARFPIPEVNEVVRTFGYPVGIG